jgi:prolyl-tRNA editing enzyme YbaK/EbsC (Cys-tRNA(Pro) deacylase)
MNAPLPSSAQKVQDIARRLNLAIAVREMPQSTRTAEEAAAACGCAVGQIVKSLVFEGSASGQPYLLLVSGANRVDQDGVAATVGETLLRPDAARVRGWTGFAIGGIPPFGARHAAEDVRRPGSPAVRHRLGSRRNAEGNLLGRPESARGRRQGDDHCGDLTGSSQRRI